ncbi:MAG: site-2 protease family protein [Acidimicrobiales bacterium]
MKESFRIGRVSGIAIGVNWSIIAIFVLIAVSLAAGRFPDVYPDQSPLAYAIAGLVTAVLFFASVLAHEISHALVAQRNGIEVDGIVLWLLGGVARLRGDADSPGVAFRISVIGPVVSFVLGIAFLGVAAVLDQAGTTGLVVESALWLGAINIVLAVFNLFPGAPLDGGRVLRSILWKFSGDKQRSWVQAAKAGQVVGFVVIGLGILQFAAIGVGGLWLMLIGWFLVMAARAEQAHAELQSRLGDRRVAEFMSADPVTAPGDISVDEFLDRYVFRHNFSSFPITDDGGPPIGLATVKSVRHVPVGSRSTMRLRELATPIDEVTTAGPDDPISDVLDGLGDGAGGRILVTSGSRLVGIVSPADIMRVAEVSDLLGDRSGRPRPDLRGRADLPPLPPSPRSPAHAAPNASERRVPPPPR